MSTEKGTPKGRDRSGTDIRLEGGNAVHSFNSQETKSFAAIVNTFLQDDTTVSQRLPITHEAFFESLSDGVLLCRLLTRCAPGSLDEAKVLATDNMNPFQKRQNAQLFLDACTSLGVTVVNIDGGDIVEGKWIVLGVIWQIAKLGLFARIVDSIPQLCLLLQATEDLQYMHEMPEEELVLRWINYHVSPHGLTVKNFTSDIKDGKVYAVLAKICCAEDDRLGSMSFEDILASDNALELAISAFTKQNLFKFVTEQDIVEGDMKLNFAFSANLLKQRNGFPSLQEAWLTAQRRADAAERKAAELENKLMDLDQAAVNLVQARQSNEELESKLSALTNELGRLRLELTAGEEDRKSQEALHADMQKTVAELQTQLNAASEGKIQAEAEARDAGVLFRTIKESFQVKKRGWLRKQGGQFKTWKSRWSILRGNMLFYFKTEGDEALQKPKGVVYIDRYEAIEDPEDGPRKNLLILKAKNGAKNDFHMQAGSEEEKLAWRNVLKEALDMTEN